MKKLSVLSLCLGCFFAAGTGHAMDLKQSKVTQVVNDVEIISAADQSQKNAAVNDIFTMPDILKTGPASRAELVAADETVTRVGANTIFSFDPANRTIDLKQGSLLFHSPHGKGGGTIHTGSATASVLGTTLIITTTPSGGFKVLDLEGSVEVKFLNGLNQKLAPGQMSFVLPGGNQLAPIIVFRLDDLTKNSQLVKGFNQSLASLPLIEQQINQQLKLIQSGKLSDTGLEVGSGDATPTKVPVIDPNTLQSALDGAFKNPNGVDKALAADATINQLSLTDPGIPTPPARVFVTEPFLLTSNPFFTGQPFEGFAAKNIHFYFNYAGLFPVNAPQTLTVDLLPYAAQPEFDFVAAQNIYLNGSINFSGLSTSDNVLFSLVAGNQFVVASGSSIEADTANFEWQSSAALTLDAATVLNRTGNTAFGIGSDFTMQNGSYLQTDANLTVRAGGNLNLNGSTVIADTAFFQTPASSIGLDSSTLVVDHLGVISAAQAVTINNSSLTVGNSGGSLAIHSGSGSVSLAGTSVQAQYLTVNSGDGILLDGTGATFSTYGAGSSANFTAKNLLAANNADLSHYATVNMAANTINLWKVAFIGTVNLRSLLGMWNNGSSQPGCVNDLGGVTYNGALVNAANGSSGTLAGTGITVGKK